MSISLTRTQILMANVVTAMPKGHPRRVGRTIGYRFRSHAERGAGGEEDPHCNSP
jgi:hypothetical protein